MNRILHITPIRSRINWYRRQWWANPYHNSIQIWL